MAVTFDSSEFYSEVKSYFTEEPTSLEASLNSTYAPPRPSLPPVDPWFHTVRFICEVAVSLPLAVLGIIGNIVAFIVLCRQKQRLTTNVLLQALAVADTLVLISTILLRSLRYVGWEAYNDVYDYVFVVLYPCVYFFRLADTWLTVMLTIDRYIAVCHPLHAQRLCTMRRTYISLAVITIGSLLFSLPRFMEYCIGEQNSIVGYKHTPLLANAVYTYVYKIGFFLVVMYLIPMTTLLVLNILLMCTLRRTYTNRNTMISDGTMHNGHGMKVAQRASRGVTIVVAIIVVICVVCNVIAMATHVLYSLIICFKPLQYLDYYRRYMANVSNIMITLNCAINFLIYCVFSRKFRSGLSQTCNCEGMRRLGRRWRSDHYSESSASANTSYTSVGQVPLRASQKASRRQQVPLQHKSSTDF